MAGLVEWDGASIADAPFALKSVQGGMRRLWSDGKLESRYEGLFFADLD
jgi:hypothetical protein